MLKVTISVPVKVGSLEGNDRRLFTENIINNFIVGDPLPLGSTVDIEESFDDFLGR